MAKGIMTIHGMGGAGINVSAKIIDKLISGTGYCNYKVNVADTSDANLNNLDHSKIVKHRLQLKGGEELNGSGGDREKNKRKAIPLISQYLKNLDIERDKSNIHIVISSMSSGSGSVLGPVLAMQLIDKGKNVVYIGIKDSRNRKTADNTLTTLMDLKKIPSAVKHTMVILPFDNKNGREDVDGDIADSINIISLFASQEHNDMDNADITSFLFQDTISNLGIKPQTLTLDIFTNSDKIDGVNGLPTLAVTLNNKPLEDVGVKLLGLKAGILINVDKFVEKPPFIMVTNANTIDNEINLAEKELRDYDSISAQLQEDIEEDIAPEDIF